MFRKIMYSILLLALFKIRCHTAQVANNTSSTQKPAATVESRFYDLDNSGMGYPNQPPGRYSPNNYPGNSYYPYGNQNGNMQRPPQSWNSNQPYFPGRQYQPSRNYRPYSGNQRYDPYQRPNYNGAYNPNTNNMNQNPNYQKPFYPNLPEDRGIYPGNMNRLYQNGGTPLNQGEYPIRPIDVPKNLMPIRYPPQHGLYPPERNYQGNLFSASGGFGYNVQPNFPDNLNNNPDLSVTLPGNSAPYENQYPENSADQGTSNNEPNQNNSPSYPLSNNPNNMEYLRINPGSNDGSIVFPNQLKNKGNNMAGFNQVLPGNVNGTPQTRPQSLNNQQINANANDTAAILGKPVFISSATSSPDQVLFDGSKESSSERKCVQNCQTTTEYVPVCGTNNVTYINPEKFYCARNCGIVVNIRQMGKCDVSLS